MMAAPLKLVKMVGSKPECAFCGCTPRDEEDNLLPGVTAEGVDINWGDNLYMCQPCVKVAGQLIGMEEAEVVERMGKQLDFRNHQVEKLQAENEKLEKRIGKMLDGSREMKAAREERKARHGK